MTTDKILDKLSKLKAAQASEAALGNTAAAEAFAAMINTMLFRHELSMEEIPEGGIAKEDPIVEVLTDLAAYGIKITQARVGWQETLAGIVAEAHLCRYLIAPGTNRLWFVGTKSNATVAEYAYGVLAAAADRMSMAAREQWWKEHCGGQHLRSGNFRAAWLHGFVVRIDERFAAARRAEVKATGNVSTALITLDKALTRAKKYVAEKYKGKSTAAASMGTGSMTGYLAGRAAADKVALNKGLSTKDTGAQRALGD